MAADKEKSCLSALNPSDSVECSSGKGNLSSVLSAVLAWASGLMQRSSIIPAGRYSFVSACFFVHDKFSFLSPKKGFDRSQKESNL